MALGYGRVWKADKLGNGAIGGGSNNGRVGRQRREASGICEHDGCASDFETVRCQQREAAGTDTTIDESSCASCPVSRIAVVNDRLPEGEHPLKTTSSSFLSFAPPISSRIRSISLAGFPKSDDHPLGQESYIASVASLCSPHSSHHTTLPPLITSLHLWTARLFDGSRRQMNLHLRDFLRLPVSPTRRITRHLMRHQLTRLPSLTLLN